MKKHKTLGILARTGFALVALLLLTLVGCPDGGGSEKPVDPGITVTVNPAFARIGRGGTYTFGATVTGRDNPAQTVRWSIVQTDKHALTNIAPFGVLTVDADEPLNTLTIRATSTVDTTKFGEATVTVTNDELIPTVNGVTVSPPTASVAKGRTLSFSATVTGANNPVQAVSWSIVQTGKHVLTTIDANGLLSVGHDETLNSLTVRATSTADTTKHGEATVTLTASVTGDNCQTCGETVNTAVWHDTKEPSCAEVGTKELRCAGCQAVLDTDTITALTHDWYWVITKPATVTETGLEEEKCSHCGAVNDTKIIPRIPGGLQITINTGGHMSSPNATITNGVLILNRSATATLVLENGAEYTNIRWRVQNTTVSGFGSSFTLNGNNPAFVIGRDYFVSVEATRNGAPYNVTITFKVEG